jgi:hypothetical protein
VVDSGTLIIAATLAGFVVGAFLTDWLSKRRERRENERKVASMRKLLYEDITTIYVELKEVFTVIEAERITSKFEEYYNALLDCKIPIGTKTQGNTPSYSCNFQMANEGQWRKSLVYKKLWSASLGVNMSENRWKTVRIALKL